MALPTYGSPIVVLGSRVMAPSSSRTLAQPRRGASSSVRRAHGPRGRGGGCGAVGGEEAAEEIELGGLARGPMITHGDYLELWYQVRGHGVAAVDTDHKHSLE